MIINEKEIKQKADLFACLLFSMTGLYTTIFATKHEDLLITGTFMIIAFISFHISFTRLDQAINLKEDS